MKMKQVVEQIKYKSLTMQIVSPKSYPLLTDAFADINLFTHHRKVLRQYRVPNCYDVHEAEQVLASLTSDEQATFIFGEPLDVTKLMRRSAKHYRLHVLLEDYRNNWKRAEDIAYRNKLATEAAMMDELENGITADEIDVEEVKKILAGDHGSDFYYYAAAHLRVAGEHKLSFYAMKMAELKIEQERLELKFKELQKRALNPRKANVKGTTADIKFIASGVSGVYTPKVFAHAFDIEDFEGTIDDDTWATLRAGPDPIGQNDRYREDNYWNAWFEVIDKARIILDPRTMQYDENGKHNIEFYVAENEGDIYFVPVDVEGDPFE